MLNRIVGWLSGVAFAVTSSYAMASHGESEAISLNPLSLEWIQKDLALWTAVVFVLLLALLTKFAWKPIIEGLDKRERNVADQIADAEAANQKAKELLAGYEQKLASAQEQVRAILDQGRRDAEEVGREMLDKAKAEVQAEHQHAIKEIDDATNAAIKDLGDRSATLAVELAGKIVRTKLSASDHSRLIEEAVAGFAQGKADMSKASRN
jgi:F-type H+-transporting ATPase subunit b